MSTKLQIQEAEKQLEKLREKFSTERSNKLFNCVCGSKHKVRSCEAIQTYYYDENTGSPNGGFYNESEIFITCPKTGKNNRVLFSKYELNAKFRYKYSSLFKSIKDDYEKHHDNWKNNFYFEQNLKKFDLGEE